MTGGAVAESSTAARPSSRRATVAAAGLVAGVAWVFFSTALSTSHARIEALQTVEPYAFAVHEQLLATFAATGRFAQTIHRGYDDSWMWSGHRALTFLVNARLHPLWPGPLGLSGLQILATTLGCVPAAWLGRRVLGSAWGIALGGLVYLLSPPVMALALQDYQDLAFAVPCLICTVAALRAGHPAWALVGALVGVLPREECIPAVVAAAVVVWPDGSRRGRRWLLNLLVSTAVAGLYLFVLLRYFPASAGSHDNPMQEDLRALWSGQPIRLEGWPYLDGFYSLLWAPVGAVALLAPHVALPGVGLVLLHMNVPFGHGVDRHWGQHVHHLAPAVPFFVAGAVFGLARLFRLVGHPRLGWVGRFGPWVLAVGLAAWAGWWDLRWARYFNLVLAPWPVAPAYRHPAWTLVDALPDDAVPIVPKRVSLAVADRLRSYTVGDSLLDKVGNRGLAAGTHLIAWEGDTFVLEWAGAMKGARVVQSEPPYVLLTWDPDAVDGVAAAWGRDLPFRIKDAEGPGCDPGLVPGVAPPDPQPVSGGSIRAGKIGR